MEELIKGVKLSTNSWFTRGRSVLKTFRIAAERKKLDGQQLKHQRENQHRQNQCRN